MSSVGTPAHPLRVAVVGAGPAGFYAADHLTRRDDLHVTVDLLDRLPTPFGLVRGGVAPDHQKIKNVTRVYDKVAARDGVRFFGNVSFGEHVTLADLRRHYHQIVFTTGAQTDRSLGLPGEDLDGSHSATAFVAWYNGHPDYRHHTFDLSQEHVVIVGVGNVAVDVARILCRTYDELAATDIADHALEALRHSRVRTVTMLGRRGPAQAAFTYPEAKELGELVGADCVVHPDEAALDPLSQAYLEAEGDRTLRKNVALMAELAERARTDKPRCLTIRFLVSPVAFLDGGAGQVRAVRVVRNELYQDDAGRLRPRATDAFEELSAGLVFRSVGYEGVPLNDVPFDAGWKVIPNDAGRVLDRPGGQALTGLYTAGWIKRGPSGVIGTNKADAVETVEAMLEDAEAGRLLDPPVPDAEAAAALFRSRQPHLFTYADWQRLDALETARGEASGRPRVKYVDVEEMVAALEAAPA